MDIGDKVFYNGELGTILGFDKDMSSCVVQHSKSSGHSGSNPDYWFNKNGERILYIEGTNRRYFSLKTLKEYWQVGKWYEFKMNAPTTIIQIAKITKIDEKYIRFDPWIINSNTLHTDEGITVIETAELIRELKEEDECIQKFFPVEQKEVPPIPKPFFSTWPENTIGRYVKALVNYPDGGNVKQGEIGIFIGKRAVDFFSQTNYHVSKQQRDKYELMSIGYSPSQSTEDLVTPKEILIDLPKNEVNYVYNPSCPSYSAMYGVQAEMSRELYSKAIMAEYKPFAVKELETTGLKDKLLDTSVKSIKSTGELFCKPTIYLF